VQVAREKTSYQLLTRIVPAHWRKLLDGCGQDPKSSLTHAIVTERLVQQIRLGRRGSSARSAHWASSGQTHLPEQQCRKSRLGSTRSAANR